MPTCSIKQCSARKNINQPQLTIHRFPRNEVVRRKWIEIIGAENINPRHTELYACSLHFEEAAFNRTLDVIRLRDNAVPSLLLVPARNTCQQALRDMDNAQEPTQPHLAEKNVPSNKGEVLTPVKFDDNLLPSTSTSFELTKRVNPSTQEKNQPMLTKTMESAKKTIQQEHSSKMNRLQKICDAQRKKIKSLNEKLRRKEKKIMGMQDIITDLKNKMMINTEQSILLEECGGSKDFLKRQIAKSRGQPLERKYTVELRKFALTLHFLSPKAYEFIRREYNTCLPHPNTLTKWYQHINAEPGFTQEAFNALKTKVEQNNPQKVLCALVLDEMAIRKGLTWDPKEQKYHGRVDYGHNIDCDSQEEASQCLVFLLTAINGSWKLPIAYFFITSITGDQKSVLVETAIKLTEETGARVVSVTCDGPAANFSMLSALGCSIPKDLDRTNFKSGSDNTVYAFIDPCHAIKLIRNTLSDVKVLIDHSGRKIDFRYFELLLELQERQGLHLATKLSKAHLFFEKQKMKVRLATQLLSNSVADALAFCKTELQMKEFEDCEGTVNFIKIINDVFDVLNSHSIRPPGLKKAMCPENIGFIRALFDSAIDYIRLLKLSSGQLVNQ